MSEKMYVLLLRLFPSRFREAYGEEAIQLFRDRARDERGFLPTMRLWLDLLADLVVSLPREYRDSRPALASSRQQLEGVPSFVVLEDGSPRPEAFCFGAILSLAALAVFAISLNHTGGSAKERGSRRDSSPSVTQPSRFGSADTQHARSEAAASASAANGDTSLDAAERHRVIAGSVANLKQYYFDHDVAQKTADALLAHENNGDDDTSTQGATFAALLTAQMAEASHDMHLVMEYSPDPLPVGPPMQTAESLARFRDAMLQQDCMIRKVQILPHDIGYLKLDFFPDASVCGQTIKTAMASLDSAVAIIFDLRDNMGGSSDTVALVASYLFDHPEYMYGPRGAPAVDSWTRSPVTGNSLADKPVYVLTSASTWSGAEQFSYDLKMLKRATLVGETTRGGAHAGVFHRINDHFGMGIPEEKAINPFGEADWEGVGVEPDVKVKAADALEAAVKLAQARLQKK